MSIKNKIIFIILNAVPVVLMISLIPLIQNDYVLSLVYIFIIIISFLIKYNKKDSLFLAFGFGIMIVSESFFISTGVEVFVRDSLFGIMPLWLPIIWSYAFVAMRRAIVVLDQ